MDTSLFTLTMDEVTRLRSCDAEVLDKGSIPRRNNRDGDLVALRLKSTFRRIDCRKKKTIRNFDRG
jgi:hypothetical protein